MQYVAFQIGFFHFVLGRQGKDEQTEYKGFLGQWKYSHDTKMMDKCHYKLIDNTTPKVNG